MWKVRDLLLNGERINNIKYADDTSIFVVSKEKIPHLMGRETESNRRYDLLFNLDKTKLMVFSKNSNQESELINNQKRVERIKKYFYLEPIRSRRN